jgi:hypothetical protein
MKIERIDSSKKVYNEALDSFEKFHGYAADTLRGCNGNEDPFAIKQDFELADVHYKEVMRMCAHLGLLHTARTNGKNLRDWTSDEVGDNALIRSLEGMTSSMMYHLLNAYRPWLVRAQFDIKDE